MATRQIIVEPYREAWEQSFRDIQAEIEAALGELALRIEHVGSTAVPGMSAKPVIDMDVVIKDRSVLDAAISALAAIGYEHEGDLGIAGREAFRYDGKEHLQKHHLYVCALDSPELKRHIAFRDYLRSRPEAAREYSRIKEEAAALYPFDIEGYIRHKAPFIEKVCAEIGLGANPAEQDKGMGLIREAGREDIPACVAIIRKSFLTVAEEYGITEENAPRFTAFALTEDRLYRQLDKEHRPMFVYERDGVPCGYYSLSMLGNGECELNNLAVLPGYRHRGIGKRLLAHAYETARQHGCHTVHIGIVEENKPLRTWYEDSGAIHTDTKKFDFFPFTCGYMIKKL